MTQDSKDYIVVFEYTKSAGGYAGVRTWTVFGSKAEFDSFYTEAVKKDELAIAQGITQKEALELIRKTPLRSYVSAAIEDSTDPKTGKVDSDLLESQVKDIGLAVGSLWR